MKECYKYDLFITTNFQTLKHKTSYSRNKHMSIMRKKENEKSINIHNSKYEDIKRLINILDEKWTLLLWSK